MSRTRWYSLDGSVALLSRRGFMGTASPSYPLVNDEHQQFYILLWCEPSDDVKCTSLQTPKCHLRPTACFYTTHGIKLNGFESYCRSSVYPSNHPCRRQGCLTWLTPTGDSQLTVGALSVRHRCATEAKPVHRPAFLSCQPTNHRLGSIRPFRCIAEDIAKDA